VVCEVRVRVLGADVICDACGARAHLACLGQWSGWALAHYLPRVIVVQALVNGELKQMVPR
jgi:hypothetical protein